MRNFFTWRNGYFLEKFLPSTSSISLEPPPYQTTSPSFLAASTMSALAASENSTTRKNPNDTRRAIANFPIVSSSLVNFHRTYPLSQRCPRDQLTNQRPAGYFPARPASAC